jgi:CheY-like chemotaxis protein
MKALNWRKIENKCQATRLILTGRSEGVRVMGQARPMTRATRVLLVEDEVLISDMVADVLEEQGFEVYVVSNAADALRHIESGALVDVLFTDVHLPGGMDGSVLAARVRELRPDMPIVYASGRWSPSLESNLVSRSIFLAKPYDPRDAGSLMRRLVSQPH